MSEKAAPKSALAISCTSHIVQDGLTTAVYVILPVLAQVFGLSYAQVGLLKGLSSASQAILEFASGWISERLGEARLIIVGLVMSALGYGLLSFAPGIIAIAVCLLLVGAGTALHHAPSSSLIANAYDKDKRSGALGIYNASGDVGKLAFTGMFSLASGIGLAWNQISLFYALLTFASALLVGFVAMKLRQSQSENEIVEATHSPSQGTKGWGILDWRSFSSLLATTSIDTIVQTCVLVFIAFLMLAKGLSLPVATAATVVLLAGGVFGKAGCGFLAQKLGAKPAFILIQILTAIGLVVLVLAPNWLAMALLLPLGAVLQGSSSITYSFAANLIHPQKMARGYALLYSSGTLAAVGSPWLFGRIADVFEVGNAFYLMALLVLVSIPTMLPLRDEKKDPAR